jgi:hypothetical protein
MKSSAIFVTSLCWDWDVNCILQGIAPEAIVAGIAPVASLMAFV